LIGFAACFLFPPLGTPCLPVVGDCFGGAIGYLFHNFVIIHTAISLSDSSVLFQFVWSSLQFVWGRKKLTYWNSISYVPRMGFLGSLTCIFTGKNGVIKNGTLSKSIDPVFSHDFPANRFGPRNCTKGQVSTFNKQVFLCCVNYSIRPLSSLNLLLVDLTAPSHLKA
jgi:hypothetical protein